MDGEICLKVNVRKNKDAAQLHEMLCAWRQATAMLEAGERLRDFIPDLAWVSHIHISEPGLAPVRPRPEHKELALLLKAVGYRGYVSIEMADPGAPEPVLQAIQAVAEVFQ